MDNPGAYQLVGLDLTAPLAAQAQTSIDGLDGAAAITLVAEFQYGSGGTTCAVVAQVSMDGGSTWFDMARFDFLLATRRAWCVIEGLAAKPVATYAALAAEGVNNGLVGPMIRGVVTSTGTYVGTTVSLIAVPR